MYEIVFPPERDLFWRAVKWENFTDNQYSKWATQTLRKVTHNAQKMKFSIKDFFSNCDQNQQFPADLVTFTEETLKEIY